MTGPGFRWTHREVCRALGSALVEVRGPENAAFRAVSTDSRRVGEGDLFVALVGDRFDGHHFVEAALEAGAAGVVISRLPEGGDGEVPEDGKCSRYLVQDTLEALGALARHLRRQRPWTVVGITGSSGKTTVKEMARAAVAGSRTVHANPGNWNNRVGLPLSVLSAPESAEILLLEMGTSEPGEIGILTAIAEPEVGVVTTVGDAHLEGLGSREGVLAEKLALLQGLPPRGTAVVGDVPPELPDAARRLRPDVRVAGWTERADPAYRPEGPVVGSEATYRFRWRGAEVRLDVPGRVAVTDALLALAVADAVGVPAEDAARGLSNARPASMRGETRRIGGLTVLVDCYNANPQSTRAAAEILARLPARGRRVAVLGSMLELGRRADELHREVLRDVRESGADLVVAAGEFARVAGAVDDGSAEDGGAEVLVVPDPVEEWASWASVLSGDETMLIKASRGARLERLLPLLEEAFGDPAGTTADGGGG